MKDIMKEKHYRSMPDMQTDFIPVCKWEQMRQDAGCNGLSRPTCWHYEIN